MDKNCIFCRIISGELETKLVHRSEGIYVFHDINPKAPTHLLIVPSVHIKTFLDLKDNQYQVLTKMVKVVQRLIRGKNLQGSYRVLINGGSHQVVDHLHLHLLSEKKLVD